MEIINLIGGAIIAFGVIGFSYWCILSSIFPKTINNPVWSALDWMVARIKGSR